MAKEIVNPAETDSKALVVPKLEPKQQIHPKLEPREEKEEKEEKKEEPNADIRPKIEPNELYPKPRTKRTNVNPRMKTRSKLFIKSRIRAKVCKTEVTESGEAVVECAEERKTESAPPQVMSKPRGRPRKRSVDETTFAVNGGAGAGVVVAKKQRELKRSLDVNSMGNVGVPTVVKKRMKTMKKSPVPVVKKRVRWKSVAFRTRSSYGKFCRKVRK